MKATRIEMTLSLVIEDPPGYTRLNKVPQFIGISDWIMQQLGEIAYINDEEDDGREIVGQALEFVSATPVTISPKETQ